MLQDPWHMLPGMLHGLLVLSVLITWGGYECKTWQGGKKTNAGQKGRLKGERKISCSTLCINIYGHFVKLGLKASLKLLPQRNKQCSSLTSIPPFIFMSDLEVANLCDIGGGGSGTFVVGEESFKSVWECFYQCASLFMCSSSSMGRKRFRKSLGMMK
jgi:hypothetical protein